MGTLTAAGLPLMSQSPYLDWGVASATMAGEASSGDLHVVCARPHGVLVAVIDGLGHGREAFDAAQKAALTLAQHPNESVISLVHLCHKTLIGSRGVAMSVASFSVIDETMTWLSVGNVAGVLLRADVPRFGDPSSVPAREAVVMRGGVIGYDLPIVRASVTAVAPGDTLVFATDGIDSSFSDRLSLSRPPRGLAEHILEEHGKGTDDALVLAARYLGGPPTRT